MTPQLAAGLTAFVGICLLAGWASGFRNRSYVGWLGIAFLALAGWVMVAAKAKEAKDLHLASPGLLVAANVFLLCGAGAFLLAAASAVRETARRLREMRQSHDEAAQGLLEFVRASHERGEDAPPEESGSAGPDDDTA